MATTAHPYWPRSLPLPGYVGSARPGWQCAGAVRRPGRGCWRWLGAGRCRGLVQERGLEEPRPPPGAGWFLMCAGVHGVLEGYFSLRHRELPAATGLLADVWKEYAKADSRYMTSDDFTVAMETVTAWAWGPPQLPHLSRLPAPPPDPLRPAAPRLPRYTWDPRAPGGREPPSPPQRCLPPHAQGSSTGTCSTSPQRRGQAGAIATPSPSTSGATLVGLNGVWVLVPGALLADACRHLAAAQRALDRPRHKAH
ncbi:unnamed protein product [Bubo scandiacus]